MGFNRNYFNKWMNKFKTEIFDDEKLKSKFQILLPPWTLDSNFINNPKKTSESEGRRRNKLAGLPSGWERYVGVDSVHLSHHSGMKTKDKLTKGGTFFLIVLGV